MRYACRPKRNRNITFRRFGIAGRIAAILSGITWRQIWMGPKASFTPALLHLALLNSGEVTWKYKQRLCLPDHFFLHLDVTALKPVQPCLENLIEYGLYRIPISLNTAKLTALIKSIHAFIWVYKSPVNAYMPFTTLLLFPIEKDFSAGVPL